ncbi:MAG: AMP-binding protein, partial [bacterium]|nr:AMP-binding protein [bacterium]
AMNSHRALANRLLSLQRDLGFQESDAGVLKTPLTFDPWLVEAFLPLISGGRTIIAKPGGHRDMGYLIGLIAEFGVTWFNLVPSMLREFAQHPEASRCGSVRHLVSGGEVLPAAVLELVQSKLDAQVHNIYGPSETGIGATRWACPAANAETTILIGRPHANVRVYILDSRGEPVPVGVTGELFIGGDQVGLGYWRRPELTESRFVPDRFSEAPGSLLFRTGDLARYLPAGNLEFLGRR